LSKFVSLCSSLPLAEHQTLLSQGLSAWRITLHFCPPRARPARAALYMDGAPAQYLVAGSLGAGIPLAGATGSEEAGELAYAGATGRRRGVGGLGLGLGRAQLSQCVFDHRPQRLGLKGAGTQIGRDSKAGFGGAAVELRALRLAHADGDAGVFQASLDGRGRKTVGFGLWFYGSARCGVRSDARRQWRG